MKLKVAITGASGFIGRHVLTALSGHDVDITAIVRTRQLPQELSSLKTVAMDLDDAAEDTFDRLGRPDILLHFAWGGLPHYGSATHVDVELPRQRRFLESCIKGGLRRLLVTGTCLEYGLHDGELREDTPTHPTTAYATAKQKLHQELHTWRAECGLNLTWLRVFYLFGPGQSPNSLYGQLNAAIDRGDRQFPMSTGDQIRDFMPVERAADEIAKLTVRWPEAGTVNLCSGEPIRVIDIAKRWVDARHSQIALSTGRFPIPAYEPFAFWGNRSRLDALLNAT